VTLVASLLAIAAGRGLRGTLIVGAAVFCGQLSVGWSNDYLDADLDREQRRTDKPLVTGEVDRRTVGISSVVALLAAVPLSLAAGTAAAGAHFVALGSAFLYNAGFKRTPLSVLPYAVAFGLLPAFITLGPPPNHFPAVWATVAAALAGAGAHFTQALPDIAPDRASGIFGLPQMLGPELSAMMGAVLLATAAAVVALGAPSPVLNAAFGATVVLMFGTLVTALAGRLRVAFRLTLAAAAVVAIAIVLGGASF
jgi:4-hydroxybenzoate polyprenyltransferase